MDNTLGGLPKVRFGEWISEGWNMFAAQWKVWVLNTLVLSLVTVVPFAGIYILMLVMLTASAGQAGAGLGLAMLLLIFGAVVLLLLMSLYLVSGMYHTAFKQLRGEPISTSDLFSAGDRFPAVFGASIVVGLLVMIGALLCVIPGLIVAGALYFTVPLIIERRLSIGEAIQTSRDATRGDLFMFVLFAFVVSLIAQAGSYACYIGLLVTWPLNYTIAAIAYRDCFGVPGARSFTSKASAPSAYGAAPTGHPSTAPGQWSPQSPQLPPSAVYDPPVSALPTTAPQPETTTSTINPAPTGQITCPSCSAELPATARFCARCGRSLIEL